MLIVPQIKMRKTGRMGYCVAEIAILFYPSTFVCFNANGQLIAPNAI